MRNLPKLFLLIAFIFGGKFLSAQDTIVKTNNDRILATVTEVDTAVVRYKLFTSPSGPVYVIAKHDLSKIIYSDGHVDVFSSATSPASTKWKFDGDWKHPYLVGINALDLLFGDVTLSWEYHWREKISFRVPVSSGISTLLGQMPTSAGYFYYNTQKVFSAGFDLLYYPAGCEKKFSYFTGAVYEYGHTNMKLRHKHAAPPYPDANFAFGGAGIINGFLFQPSDHLNVALDMTIGYEFTSYTKRPQLPLLRAGLTVGWRCGNRAVKKKKG